MLPWEHPSAAPVLWCIPEEESTNSVVRSTQSLELVLGVH